MDEKSGQPFPLSQGWEDSGAGSSGLSLLITTIQIVATPSPSSG